MHHDADAITECVAAANAALARVAAPQADNTTHVNELQAILESDVQPRVVTLSSSAVATPASAVALMDAGVALYNASRSALRAITAQDSTTDVDNSAALSIAATSHQAGDNNNSAARFWVIAARFCACKIMRASLWQSKSCAAQAHQDTRSDQSRFVSECIDVLRSFGRVGVLLLEHAKLGSERCQQYLHSADEAFACCHEIWSQIGLSCLTKLKHDLELEEILEDLWDFNMHRIRVLQLAVGRGSDSGLDGAVEALRELNMLLPYVPGYRLAMFELLEDSSNIYKAAGQHQELAVFTEEALRVCDSAENGIDGGEDEEAVQRFKQRLLVNVLGSFGVMKDFQRADTCFSLLPQQRNPEALLVMAEIYIDAQSFDKALGYLKTLFELDDFKMSIRGARLYAQAHRFSDEALKVYQELERNYGDNRFEINLDLACNLAFSDTLERRALAMSELKRLSSQLQALERDEGNRSHAEHAERIHRAVFDASQYALNQHTYQECLEWAEIGTAIAMCERESSLYMRMLSMCNLRLGQRELAREWAQHAVEIEPSKKSLFALFNVELEGLESGDVATEAIKAITTQLKARDDFEIDDLIALAKAAHDAGPAKQTAVLDILDDICALVVESAERAGELPIGILLQHTAQLAHKCYAEAKSTTTGSCDTSDRFAGMLQMYVRLLLRASTTANHTALGPESVFEWFYAMSFRAAKSTENAEWFALAADLAKMSNEIYRDKSPLQQRESQCLLAAIACSVKSIECLDASQLNALLETVERCEAYLDEDDSRADIEYLARCVFMIKVRQFDPNTDGIFKLCQAKLPRNADEFAHLAEFVLFAATFDEAFEVRQRYRHLASDLLKYGLQTMLQSDAVAADKLCYLFRRLISLAEGKASALEWLEQFVQLAGSLDINMPEEDVEWMVAKAWNIGILHHRNQEYAEARKFMDVAMHLLEISSALAQRLRADLQAQYQLFLSSLAPSHAATTKRTSSRRV